MTNLEKLLHHIKNCTLCSQMLDAMISHHKEIGDFK